jgi:hypothetical protein
MTIVEEIIVEEMQKMELETAKDIKAFIFEAARTLETSLARAIELSNKLIAYY